MVASVAGCGLILHGSSESIHLATAPAGALVTSSDGTTCTTPCTVTLKRKEDTLLTIESNGYETVLVSIHSLFSPASATEVVIPGGLMFLGIDILSGGAYHLEPERIAVTMKPLSINKPAAE